MLLAAQDALQLGDTMISLVRLIQPYSIEDFLVVSVGNVKAEVSTFQSQLMQIHMQLIYVLVHGAYQR